MALTRNSAYKQTPIGTIPAEWELARLMDVCVKGEQRNPQTEPEKEFLYVDVSSVSNQTFKIVSATPTLGKHASSRARKVIRENDVLVATIRPSLKRVALVPKQLDEEICSTAFCVLRAKQEAASPHFLFHVLLTDAMTETIAGLERGSSYPAVTDGNVLSQVIPLPPLPEQRTIVAILSKIQQAIEVQEKIIERTKELKKSMMAKLFTEGLHGEELKESEIGLMPKSWEVADLGNVCEVYSGFAFKSEDYLSAGIPIIKIGNLQDGKVELSSDQSYFPKEMLDDSLAKYTLATGDVLVAMTGATTGKIALVSKELGGSLLNQRVGKFVVKDLSRFELSFGKHYFLTSTFQKQIRDNILQSAQGNVSPKNIERMLIPLPELSEQKDIANVFERLDSKLGTTTRKRQALQHLFKSMLHQLMTGTIRVNNIEL